LCSLKTSITPSRHAYAYGVENLVKV